MAAIDGSTITARALKNEGVDTLFFILGGPITPITNAAHKLGIRCVDVRHEQAAANMAHAYSRVTGRPGICVTASGPGTANAAPGIVNANADCCPVIHLGGSSAAAQFGMGAFQEVDQLAMALSMKSAAYPIVEARDGNARYRAIHGHPGRDQRAGGGSPRIPREQYDLREGCRRHE